MIYRSRPPLDVCLVSCLCPYVSLAAPLEVLETVFFPTPGTSPPRLFRFSIDLSKEFLPCDMQVDTLTPFSQSLPLFDFVIPLVYYDIRFAVPTIILSSFTISFSFTYSLRNIFLLLYILVCLASLPLKSGRPFFSRGRETHTVKNGCRKISPPWRRREWIAIPSFAPCRLALGSATTTYIICDSI